MKKYINDINEKNIKKAIVFSTSWISKHSIDLIKKSLKEKGIEVEEEYIYYKNMPNEKELKEAEELAKKIIG